MDPGRLKCLPLFQEVSDGLGDFFGEMGLLEKDRRNASVVATSDLRAMTMTGWDLKRLEKTAPGVVARIRQMLDERRQSDAG